MPGPRVPASECLRGLPATAAPHAPRAAPSAAPPALRPSSAPSPLYLPPSSARASCHRGARRAGGPRLSPPIGSPVMAPPPGPALRQRRTSRPRPGPLCPLRGFAPQAPTFGSAATAGRSERQRHDAARVTGKVWLRHRRVQKKVSRQRGS